MSVGDWVVPSTAVGSWQTDALVGQEELVKIRNDISAPHAACLSISPVTGEDHNTLRDNNTTLEAALKLFLFRVREPSNQIHPIIRTQNP